MFLRSNSCRVVIQHINKLTDEVRILLYIDITITNVKNLFNLEKLRLVSISLKLKQTTLHWN